MYSGEVVIGADFVEEFLKSPRMDETDDPAASKNSNFHLSQREAAILRLLSKGISNNEIARLLFISKHTVKVRVSHILQKMQVHSRQQAAILALHIGIASDDPRIDG